MGRGRAGCSVIWAVLTAATCILVFRSEIIAAANDEKLEVSQKFRDTLFQNLKSSQAEYSFDYLVIYLPPGSIPGINSRIPVSHIRFSSTVFFGFDRFQLEEGAERPLGDLARSLTKDSSFKSLLVVGHTDSTGPDNYNSWLALNRAVTVASRLRALGIRDEVIGVVPMGEAQPASSNSSPAGRSLNRRVEFFISDLPEATARAIELINFDPCHRNDHSAAEIDCAAGDARVPVYGSSGRGQPKKVLELTRTSLPANEAPPLRPSLPNVPLTRPSLRHLQ